MQFSQRNTQLYPKHTQLTLEEAITLGLNVARLRKEQSMSITTFAQVAGISRPTLYKIESGESDLKLSMITRVAQALDTSVLDLLTPHNSSSRR
ncbi:MULTISPECIES: helix-turn-helix domain-containing protein [unclassified Adlercreutzia]|uniref:helix-turn-helix domain-containing protein n=1 Tax=unclassified Adlercreutzia TaxID=2636013 RepID=UPI0013EBA762|nr:MULTISPECIES: helix-turn-helix transcriptional regulator [unclassified Adlercreutzia]